MFHSLDHPQEANVVPC